MTEDGLDGGTVIPGDYDGSAASIDVLRANVARSGEIGQIVAANYQRDLDPGAPELRADSRYNRDNAFMVSNYAASADVLVVMIKTGADQCTQYDTLAKVDALAWQLEQLPGVEATNSMALLSKLAATGYNEGNFKWYDLTPNQSALGAVQTRAPRELFNQSCSMLSLYVYLKDHKAATLSGVVDQASNSPRATARRRPGSCSRPAAPASKRRPTSSSRKPCARCCSGSTAR